jgi:hypothetical protein
MVVADTAPVAKTTMLARASVIIAIRFKDPSFRRSTDPLPGSGTTRRPRRTPAR